jgi:hypothetical protein
MEYLVGLGCLIFFLGWLLPSPFSWLQLRKLRQENQAYRDHLHTQMEINAAGLHHLKHELTQLKLQNENLRITTHTLGNQPGRAELRLLHSYDRAINIMLAKAPGFAPVWQAVIGEVEKEMRETEHGVRAFMRKIIRPSAPRYSLSHESLRLLNSQPPEEGSREHGEPK